MPIKWTQLASIAAIKSKMIVGYWKFLRPKNVSRSVNDVYICSVCVRVAKVLLPKIHRAQYLWRKIRSHSSFNRPHKHENLMIIPIYMNLHSRLFAKSNFTAINDEGKTKPEVEGKAKTEWQNIFPIFHSTTKKKLHFRCVYILSGVENICTSERMMATEYFRRIIFGWDFF